MRFWKATICEASDPHILTLQWETPPRHRFLQAETETDTSHLNTLMPGKMAATLADDIFKCISLTENVWILNIISLKYVS